MGRDTPNTKTWRFRGKHVLHTVCTLDYLGNSRRIAVRFQIELQPLHDYYAARMRQRARGTASHLWCKGRGGGGRALCFDRDSVFRLQCTTRLRIPVAVHTSVAQSVSSFLCAATERHTRLSPVAWRVEVEVPPLAAVSHEVKLRQGPDLVRSKTTARARKKEADENQTRQKKKKQKETGTTEGKRGGGEKTRAPNGNGKTVCTGRATAAVLLSRVCLGHACCCPGRRIGLPTQLN